MIELPESIMEVPALGNLVIIVGVCALASYSLTWLLRGVFPATKKWHWKLRLAAVVSGTLVGLMVAGYPWGVATGLASGGLTTSVVAFVKSKLKKRPAATGSDEA
jgi:membrane protease YdiL (CAAX protease family)